MRRGRERKSHEESERDKEPRGKAEKKRHEESHQMFQLQLA